jgi:RimJ/RimL family protein N-acetyltransferase
MVHPASLENAFVRLESLRADHADALHAAAREEPGLYALAPVPVEAAGMRAYVDRALADAAAGQAVPFAIARKARGQPSDRIVGCTRFMSLEWWSWPPGAVQTPGEPRRADRGDPPDVVEIGHVWLAASSLRTAVNTAACLLMMAHAFDTWRVHRLTLKTDVRNHRSRAAIERLGGQFEGVLRAHLPAADGIVRDTAMYSVLPREWPAIKVRLESALASAQYGTT